MAARAVISLLDGQATPVTHTFSPNSGDGNVPGTSVISYEDRVGGVSVGFNRVSISTRQPSKQNRNYKVAVLIQVPVLEVVSNSTVSGIAPAPQAAYVDTVRMEFILPERSSVQSRKDLLAYTKNLLANAVMTSSIVDLEQPW